jgi:NAD(P)-dependent dehydrogenase (short-subunit alcohol dehydrogenase family)
MAGRFEGKVGVVTGGASGIGLATAQLFVKEGGSVVIADLKAERAEAAARQLGSAAAAIGGDVTDEARVAEAVDLAVSRFGRLDCMVNNAGILGAVGPISRTDTKAWNDTVAILLNAVFFGMKHAARVMMAQRSGSIISLSSIAGVAGGLGPHAYSACKHAVVGLTRSVSSELAAHNIRVNAVAPGTTITPLVIDAMGGGDPAQSGAAAKSPMKSVIMPEEIAAGILYLASDDARHLTGQTLVIDSGMTGAISVPRYHGIEPAFVASPNL